MAKVPLRLYIREIENLIDRGQTEEALAHCKYILETYPKCIDIYRLLGKAYLETQRYSEAADILQRVLSSVPDDFVSQVGMSIIREDEGDLNASVWHMERAYESQPSNGAVQEELRRLYGRRDGSEPPKIRMTRGALVRMYARGHLYEQAIAEVRAALDEDPQRSDLQVLLAKLYAQTGARVEATSLCSELISKFPYSYEANRILSEILPSATRANDIQTYRQRVIDLDPYMAFASVDKPVVEVPDQEVALERLEWEPGHGDSAQPSWASTIGINLNAETGDEHVLPDWLASLSSVAPMAENQGAKFDSQPFSAPAIPNIASDPARRPQAPSLDRPDVSIPPAQSASAAEANLDLPDWMKDAGWSSANGQANEEPFAFDTNQDAGEAIMNTDLPEWLQTLAPEKESDISDGDVAEAAEQFAWLEDISKAKATTGGLPLDDASLRSKEDWLQGARDPDQANEMLASISESAAAVPSGEIVPDWLKEGSEPNALADLNPDVNAPEIPEWVNAAEPGPFAQSPSIDLPQFTDNKEDTMAWLEELASQHNSEAPTMIIRPGQRVSQPPSWIDEQPEELPPAGFEQQVPLPVAAAPSLPQDLMPEDKGHGESLLTSINETIPDLTVEPLPQQNQPGQDVMPAPIQPEQSDALPADEFPAWLVDLAQPPASPAVTEGPQVPQTETFRPFEPGYLKPTPQSENTTQDDEKAAMAWLDQLSSTPPEEPEAEDQGLADLRHEVSSAWTTEEIAAPQNEAEQTPGIIDQMPDQSEETETAPVAEAASPSLELPDWLKMIDEPQAEAEMQAVPGQFDLAKTEADLDSWLKENAAPQDTPTSPAFHLEQPEPVAVGPETTQAVPPPAEDDMPAWVIDLDQTVKGQEPVIMDQPSAEAPAANQPEEEAMPLWLQEFAPSVTAEPETQALPAAEPGAVVEPAADSVLPLAEIEEQPNSQPETEPAPKLEPLAVEEALTPVAAADDQPAVEESGGIEPPTAFAQPEVNEPTFIQEEVAPVVDAQPAEAAASILTQEAAPVSLEDTEPVVISQPEKVEALPEGKAVPAETIQAPTPAKPVQAPSIAEAQAALRDGHFDTAMACYDQIIHSNEHLEETIHNLREALYQYPVEIALWQTLGDAYVRSNQLQEAINAYTKAEELIR